VRKQGKGKGGGIRCEREKEIRGKRDELQQATKAERGDEVAMRKKKYNRSYAVIHCKKVSHFPFPSLDVTYQTLPGWE
jgi:hypothetical protein